jgi:ribonuclease HI
MVYLERAILYFDGASQNNPKGPAGCGFVVKDMDNEGERVVLKGYKYLGRLSNNQAEYSGLLEGLKAIAKHLEVDELHICGDSEMVIKQVIGSYQVRSSNIRPFYSEVMKLLGSFPAGYWSATHVGRNQNITSDHLAKRAIENGDSKVELYV